MGVPLGDGKQSLSLPPLLPLILLRRSIQRERRCLILRFESLRFLTAIAEEDIRLIVVKIPVKILIADTFPFCGTVGEAMLLNPASEIPTEI